MGEWADMRVSKHTPSLGNHGTVVDVAIWAIFDHFWAFLVQFLAYFWSFLTQKSPFLVGKIANGVRKIPKFVGSFLACPKAWLCIKLPTLAISHSVYDGSARQMPILVQKCTFLAVRCPNDVGKIPIIVEHILLPQITCWTIISHLSITLDTSFTATHETCYFWTGLPASDFLDEMSVPLRDTWHLYISKSKYAYLLEKNSQKCRFQGLVSLVRYMHNFIRSNCFCIYHTMYIWALGLTYRNALKWRGYFYFTLCTCHGKTAVLATSEE